MDHERVHNQLSDCKVLLLIAIESMMIEWVSWLGSRNFLGSGSARLPLAPACLSARARRRPYLAPGPLLIKPTTINTLTHVTENPNCAFFCQTCLHRSPTTCLPVCLFRFFTSSIHSNQRPTAARVLDRRLPSLILSPIANSIPNRLQLASAVNKHALTNDALALRSLVYITLHTRRHRCCLAVHPLRWPASQTAPSH